MVGNQNPRIRPDPAQMPGIPSGNRQTARTSRDDTQITSRTPPRPASQSTGWGKDEDVSRTAAQAATGYTGVFRGRPDQVGHARHAIARHLAGHPAADDAALIISELAANAVLHSRSAGQFFTVRARPDDTGLHVEVEDLGGPWHPAPRDTSRPHGLDVIEALTGPGNWGINGDGSGRTAWARLSW
jgi:serine/threonine-protein kinase RsbW